MQRIERHALVSAFSAWALLAGLWDGRAQAPAPQPATIQAIEVAEPGGQILSFRHLSGTTEVLLKGTKVEPGASTRLKVESRPGFLEIDINRGEIKGLQPARRFGKDFHTYVLWAVSVDGAAANLGEITFDQTGPVSINVTTPYQTFWLMVTAEPDFAVNDPSPVAVLYSVNQDAVETTNKALPVPGKLLYYTYYTRYDTSPATAELAVPNELLQARKAVELASGSGILAAPTPAGEEPLPDEVRTRETLEQARKFLAQAEDAFKTGGNTREAVQFARTAAQIAENARALAVGAVGGLFLRQLERQLARARDEGAKCQAELASLRERLQKVEAELAEARARGEECDKQLASLRDALQKSQAESARLREDREKICGELRRQLASLGQLTQQGGDMVLTLASDILFDSGSYELKPAARENLAKLGVLRMLLFAGADVRYAGHTDRVGEDDYNQWLSEQRALAVYRYYLQEELSRQSDPLAREKSELRLVTVDKLAKMSYAASRRGPSERQALLAELGDTVIGKGEREPIEDVPGASERNRRVVLLFPPAQVGQVTALCGPEPAAQ